MSVYKFLLESLNKDLCIAYICNGEIKKAEGQLVSIDEYLNVVLRTNSGCVLFFTKHIVQYTVDAST